jgi:hypothetical protein
MGEKLSLAMGFRPIAFYPCVVEKKTLISAGQFHPMLQQWPTAA